MSYIYIRDNYIRSYNYRHDATTVTPSDHSGHNHCSLISARPLSWNISPQHVMTAPVPSLASLSMDFGMEFTESTSSPQNIAAYAAATQESANVYEEQNETNLAESAQSPDAALSVINYDGFDLNLSNDNDYNSTIQPPSPTASGEGEGEEIGEFVLGEEIVPFSTDATDDSIFLDLDLPTIYGNRRPSSDLDLLLLSRNNSLSASRESLYNPLSTSPLNPHFDDDASIQIMPIVECSVGTSSNGAQTNDCGTIAQTTNNDKTDFVENVKTRNSVFHILLQGIVDKIEVIREKTGATVTFYITFEMLEFNEKNVHKYLKAREAKLGGSGGKYSRFNLLFNKGIIDGQGRRSPQSSLNANSNSTNSPENDHDYELHCSRMRPDSDSEPESAEDHLYAATLVRQRVSSSTVHDHQYNDEAPLGCFMSNRLDPVLWGDPMINKPVTSASAAPSKRGSNARYPFTTNSHRHRCLKNLVEALFEKIKGLENKTGARVISLTISYEENLINRQNFVDVFFKLLGTRKTSFLTKFADDKSPDFGLQNQPNSSMVNLNSGHVYDPTTQLNKNMSYNNMVILDKDTGDTLSYIGSSEILQSGNSVDLTNTDNDADDDASGASDDSDNVTIILSKSQAAPAKVVTQVDQNQDQTTNASQFCINDFTSHMVICAKCSRTAPQGCRNMEEWSWLRCFNPLCFYMVHSSCLGFCANFGFNSIDLRQFTFPPFYCEEHRLAALAATKH